VAEIRSVREVTLKGSADFDIWRDELKAEGLVPARSGGRAAVVITGTSARFKGLPFRELAVAVAVAPPEGSPYPETLFLAQAFNSSRLLAWCERTAFRTPYLHAQVRVDGWPSPGLTVQLGGAVVFEARLESQATGKLKPAGPASERWEGLIYLPSRRGRPGGVFFARLEGATMTVTAPPGDGVTLHAHSGLPTLGTLAESGFVAEEWLVREGAVHCRSKTFTRSGGSDPVW
jgi:hypothetical protein